MLFTDMTYDEVLYVIQDYNRAELATALSDVVQIVPQNDDEITFRELVVSALHYGLAKTY